MHEAFYIHAMLHSAKAAVNAFSRYSLALQNGDEAEVVVSAVQEALTHSAALSRYFWPSRQGGTTKARGEKLRIAFRMETSCLRNRELRDAIEHFDERLDENMLGDPIGVTFPTSLVGDWKMANDPLGNIFRLVDPSARIFVLLGKPYDFGSVQDEVERVLAVAQGYDRAGCRLPRNPIGAN
jgi:hypothetical protein